MAGPQTDSSLGAFLQQLRVLLLAIASGAALAASPHAHGQDAQSTRASLSATVDYKAPSFCASAGLLPAPRLHDLAHRTEHLSISRNRCG